jgi:hypothetical protein
VATNKEIIDAIPKCTSIRQVLILVGLVPAGGNYKRVKNIIDENSINITHMTGKGWNTKNKSGNLILNKKASLEEILVLGSSYKGGTYKLKNKLLSEGIKDNVCEECGITEWMGNPISFELHHVNGNGSDNRLENIKFLCPNCHAQTLNYRGKNKKKT